MKCAGKIAVCLAGGLALHTSLRAGDATLPGNPYAPVVVRNIFGLNPPPLVDPNAKPVEPPVKITPNGIMSIFGQLQVLFKVAGKPPGQDSYTLGEGERQDDIEVTKIDEKAGVVTFNNHGVEQKLPLVVGTPSSTPAPAASTGGNTVAPGIPPRTPGGNAGANGFNNTFGKRGGNFPGRNPGNGGNNPGGMNPGGMNGGGSNPQSFPAHTDSSGLTPEQNMIMIAAQHAKAQQDGNPMAAIFPPTPIDEDAGVVAPPAP